MEKLIDAGHPGFEPRTHGFGISALYFAFQKKSQKNNTALFYPKARQSRIESLRLYFFVLSVSTTVPTVLGQFNAFRVLSFVLRCRIVLPLALGALHINDGLHP
jgi:hypothetical protein